MMDIQDVALTTRATGLMSRVVSLPRIVNRPHPAGGNLQIFSRFLSPQ